jgi:predicted Fe-Mo cluster-binding NifX family protein
VLSCLSLACHLRSITTVMKRQKIALPIWSGQICTVFDFAQSLLVVEVEGMSEISRKCYTLPGEPPLFRARRLWHLGVQTLICGALSHPLMTLLSNYGITVIPYVCGHVDEVLRAYMKGGLSQPYFRLPGWSSILKGKRKRRGGWRS